MIRVQNLQKIYKTTTKSGNIFKDFFQRDYQETQAVNNISFEIAEDELVGFVGPNGAGKTTTLKILAGILYPSSGKVMINRYIPFNKEKNYLKQIAFVMGQKNQLLWELPAQDSFLLNKEIYELSEGQFNKNLTELVEMLNCQKLLKQPVKTLSLGQRMRMELIASLLHEPKILFLDEPTIGLDIFAHTTIVNFIREYQKQKRSTIILTSHYMKDIEELAGRIILIDHGRLIFDGQLRDLRLRFNTKKLLRIILSNNQDLQFLETMNLKFNYEKPQLSIEIDKNQLNELLPQITAKLSFTDLNLEEEPIEEMIKKVFREKTQG
jgi:ABC-2 type transport system ATP-binding protein